MKKIILPLLLSCLTCTLAAQETQTPPVKAYNRELGIFGQTEPSGENQFLGMIGLQYKRWHGEHLGFRVIGAFAQYTSSSSQLQYAQDDTSFIRQERFNINLPIAGFGIEAQRHFYKKIYLFAALELKGGYGNGSVDTILSKTIGRVNPGQPTTETFGRRDASLLYIGMTASVGAKVQWSRICLGLEILPVNINYTRIDNGINGTGIMDMSLGNFSQRLFCITGCS